MQLKQLLILALLALTTGCTDWAKECRLRNEPTGRAFKFENDYCYIQLSDGKWIVDDGFTQMRIAKDHSEAEAAMFGAFVGSQIGGRR